MVGKGAAAAGISTVAPGVFATEEPSTPPSPNDIQSVADIFLQKLRPMLNSIEWIDGTGILDATPDHEVISLYVYLEDWRYAGLEPEAYISRYIDPAAMVLKNGVIRKMGSSTRGFTVTPSVISDIEHQMAIAKDRMVSIRAASLYEEDVNKQSIRLDIIFGQY